VAGRLVLPDTITAIAARQDHLYLWTGTKRLTIIDVHDPETPRRVGWVDLEDVSLAFPKVEVAGDHVFILPRNPWGWFGIDPTPGIRVVDVRDPAAPVEVALVEGVYGSFAISGGNLAALTKVADVGWRVDLHDVSDPTAPALLGSYGVSATLWVGDVTVDGAFVYVSSDAGLEVIDFSDPTHPIQAGASDGLHLRRNSGVAEGHIYTHVGSVFDVIDVRDPHNPVLRGTCETPWTYGEPEAMDIVGGLVFMSHAYQGLVVVDVRDPSNPAVIGQLTEGFGEDVAVAGRYAIRLHWYFRQPPNTGLLISDLSAPGGPTEIGRNEIDWGSPTKLAVEGDTAYLMSREGGIEEVDIRDPSTPRLVGRIQTAFNLRDIAVTDDFAYLVVDRFEGPCHGLQILDVAHPDRFEAVAGRYGDFLAICDIGSPRSIAVSGSHAFLGTESALVVIDVSDPLAPYEVARVATPAADIAIRGSYAFVAAAQVGLRVYDIRVPTVPQLVSELVLPETFWSPYGTGAITVEGRRAYLGSSQLQVIDISDPTRPRELWNYPRGSGPLENFFGNVAEVAVAGGSAFLAQSWLGSMILDISGCGQPRPDPRPTRFDSP
jgi:hypothetical protein